MKSSYKNFRKCNNRSDLILKHNINVRVFLSISHKIVSILFLRYHYTNTFHKIYYYDAHGLVLSIYVNRLVYNSIFTFVQVSILTLL